MEQVKGSVTIFFSLIVLCLIAFLTNVFDMTRIQCMRYEAISNCYGAAEMAMSQFDADLLQEYGLFAGVKGVETEVVLQESIKAMYYPDSFSNREYFVDYVLNQPSNGVRVDFMTPDTIKFDVEYIDYLDKGIETPWQQIKEFMTYRQDYLFIHYFTDKLGFVSKASKSGKIIEEKNQLIESLTTINDIKLQMMSGMDGIYVNEDDQGYFSTETPYLRQYSYDGGVDYTYFPESMKQSAIETHVSVISVCEDIRSGINSIDSHVNLILQTDLFQHMIYDIIEKQGYVIIEDLIENWTPDGNESLSNSISFLRNEAELLLEDLAFKVDELQQLSSATDDMLTLVNRYIETCSGNAETIKEYQATLASEDDLMTGVVESVNEELESILVEIDNENSTLNRVNNVMLIQEILLENKEILDQGNQYLELLHYNFDNYVYRSYLSHLADYDFNEYVMTILEGRIFGNLNKNTNEALTESYVINHHLDSLSSGLESYNPNMLFDYTMIEGIEDEVVIGVDYVKLGDTLKYVDLEQVLNNPLIPNPTELSDIISVELPSIVLTGNENAENATELSGDNIQQGSMLMELMSHMKTVGTLVEQSLLMNEYIIGMFRNVAKGNLPNSTTLNHYNFDKHELQYEVEYVLGGSLDETKNLMMVLGMLFGVRFVLNGIHVAVDPIKRQTIINLATSIAGWWSGGIGIAIFSVLIGVAWALIESLADVVLLATGESVPIIKTSNTWYTALEGNWQELFNGVVRAVENQGLILMDEIEDIVADKAEELQDILSSNGGMAIQEIEDVLGNVFDETSQSMAMETEVYSEQVSNQLDQYCEESIQQLISTGDVLNPIDINDIEYELFEMVRLSIIEKGDQLNITEESSLSDKIQLKESVLSDNQNRVSDLISQFSDMNKNLLEITLDAEMLLFEKQIEEWMDQGKDIGKKALHQFADNVKKTLKEKAGQRNSQFANASNWIPSFDYEDYMRLFLLLPIVDHETKVARTMDLIQFNMNSSNSDELVTFDELYSGLNVTLYIQEETMFLPSMWLSDGIKVSCERSYYDGTE